MGRRLAKNKLHTISKAAMLLAIVVLLIGAAIAWKQLQDNKAAMQGGHTASSAGTPFIDDTTPPATNKPDKNEFESHTVAADAPRYILIPKISVEAIVKSLGLDKKGRIGAPTNVHYAGWFTGSSTPGRPGTTVIDGHLSSWETTGVFYDLKKLKAGDTIIIESGDGKKYEYKVVKSQVYDADKVDMETVLKPINTAKSGLNLITCAGKVIKGTNDFDKRLVVFAEQI